MPFHCILPSKRKKCDKCTHKTIYKIYKRSETRHTFSRRRKKTRSVSFAALFECSGGLRARYFVSLSLLYFVYVSPVHVYLFLEHVKKKLKTYQMKPYFAWPLLVGAVECLANGSNSQHIPVKFPLQIGGVAVCT